jgi:hypothetical protein
VLAGCRTPLAERINGPWSGISIAPKYGLTRKWNSDSN